jgi:hypothetical protein
VLTDVCFCKHARSAHADDRGCSLCAACTSFRLDRKATYDFEKRTRATRQGRLVKAMVCRVCKSRSGPFEYVETKNGRQGVHRGCPGPAAAGAGRVTPAVGIRTFLQKLAASLGLETA